MSGQVTTRHRPGAEGLIGFKLQALVNAPKRIGDRADILSLLRAGRGNLDMQEVRRYFELFDRANLLDELLEQISHEQS